MKLALIVALPCFLTACSVHPLPDDVTPDNTLSIVNKVRCEAKEAMKNRLLQVLAEDPQDLKSLSTHNRIKSGNLDVGDVTADMISAQALAKIDSFANSGIGMAFTLTATEADNGAASAKFALPFTDGALNLSVNAGKNLTRKNVRTVSLAETWQELVDQDCSQVTASHRNMLYPITGEIGLAEVLDTYIDLISQGPKKVKAFSEKLTFTTQLLGGVQPSLELKPLADKLKLVNANGNFSATRTDEHDVLIVLSKPVPPTDDLVVKLADNVKLVVTAPKGKYAKPKSTGVSGQPSRKVIPQLGSDAAARLRNDLFNELNRLQSLDTDRQILDSLQ